MRSASRLAFGLAATLQAAVPLQAHAQGAHTRGEPLPPGLPLAERAALRMPQPVRVGDLAGRQVLEPSNHQHVLGRGEGIARAADGSLLFVFRYGGLLGIGTRTLAVPVEATALLGQFIEVVDVDQDALAKQAAWTGAGATTLGADEVVRIGVTRN